MDQTLFNKCDAVTWNPTEVPLNDQKTWNMVCRGLTGCCFQLDKPLGQTYSEIIKPKNITDLSDLISLIRPGALESKIDKVNMPRIYSNRKNLGDDVSYLHSDLKDIMSSTYGIMCIHENTMVYMKDGTFKAIKNISVGDKVLCKQGFGECQKVGKTRECFGKTITLENGHKLDLTPDHKVLTFRGFVQVQNLLEDDIIACPKYNKFNPTFSIDKDKYDFMKDSSVQDINYLVGQLIGDGCLGNGCCIAAGSLEKAKNLEGWINDKVPTLKTRVYHNILCHYVSIIDSTRWIPKKSSLYKFLEDFDIKNTGCDKTIPMEFLSQNIDCQKSLFMGLMDSDGHTNKYQKTIHFTSTCENTLQRFKKLCLNIGLQCNDKIDKRIHIKSCKNLREFYKLPPHYDGFEFSYGVLPAEHYFDGIKEKYGTLKNASNMAGVSYTTLKNMQAFVARKNVVYDKNAGRLGLNFEDLAFFRIDSISDNSEKSNYYGIDIYPYRNLICNNVVIKNCYQEQAMKIAQKLANFSGSESDKHIRKSVGKKSAEGIAIAKEMFLDRAVNQNKISKDVAEAIFTWIEKSGRYLFNFSHGISYSLNNYYFSSYPKANFTKEFFCVEMDFAHLKQGCTELENLRSIIDEASKMQVEVRLPDIRYFNTEFKILNGQLLFGLKKIKGVSKSSIQKLQKAYPELAKMQWDDIVLGPLKLITYGQAEALLMSGAFNWTGLSRAQMLHDHSIANSKESSMRLNDKERQYLIDKKLKIREGLQYLINNPETEHLDKRVVYNKNSLFNTNKRLFYLNNPHRVLRDSMRRVIKWETQVLGKEFTYNKIDLVGCADGDYRCVDFQRRQVPIKTAIEMPIIVKDIREYNSFDGGGKMCYFKGYDRTSVFPSFKVDAKLYEQAKPLLLDGEPIFVGGILFKNKYGQQTFSVEKIEEL